ncbi:hypothetical protein VF07_08590 [Nostoc linckia z6]|nr:hypothetical protein VF07_08590 [Nostoc linckia z6]
MYNHGFRSVYRLNAHILLVVKYRRKAINAEILNRLKEIITDTLKKWKEFPWLAKKYFYNKPYFWTGAYFVASCGGVTVEQLKNYVENQQQPKQ